ncbi:unnamed protein product [Timema podura]|uniref:Uncharacterized protein n=1 Tax=Timema podura TaxID=61482 RepID=A0ABN7P363_TIMPD|nr:unnamed protein product [Timema podura]
MLCTAVWSGKVMLCTPVLRREGCDSSPLTLSSGHGIVQDQMQKYVIRPLSSVGCAINPRATLRDTCKILIVGTGGLALWALRIAGHHFINIKNRISITVASLKDEGFTLAKECEKVNVVQWNEDVYEKQLIERTIDACKGKVNIVIDFGTTSRSLHRSLQCLSKSENRLLLLKHTQLTRLRKQLPDGRPLCPHLINLIATQT